MPSPLAVEVVTKHEMAVRLNQTPMRCPVRTCKGKLLRESSASFPGRITDRRVPKWHIGCDGAPMHVWSKEHLYMLERHPPKVVFDG